MKKIAVLLLIQVTFIQSKSFSQSSVIYFKAEQAILQMPNGKNIQGSTDDKVLIDEDHEEIMVLSESAAVYKILSKTPKKTMPNPFTTYYTVSNNKGEKFWFVLKESSSLCSFTIVNLDNLQTTQLNGKLGRVF